MKLCLSFDCYKFRSISGFLFIDLLKYDEIIEKLFELFIVIKFYINFKFCKCPLSNFCWSFKIIL